MIVDCSLSCPVIKTPRLMQLLGIFDVPPTERSENHFKIELPIEQFDWNIGLIIGPSGSGKTTVARNGFGPKLHISFNWPQDKSLVDGFPTNLAIKEITGLLSSVGFSSPPSWLRPFRCLSTGEQFRATLARALAESPELAVIDEFTSVIDRQVAQIGSAAVAKSVRRSGRKLIAVSCHFDIVDWLDPDWILEMPQGVFTRRSLRQRPEIELEIMRTDKTAWPIFKNYHYLNTSLAPGAICFVGVIFNRPAAFTAVMHFPTTAGGCWREHRTVCLPDFQGVGIGNALSEFVASLFLATGKHYISITGNPAMIAHRNRSRNWKLTRKPSLSTWKLSTSGLAQNFSKTGASNRLTASFRYVGPVRHTEAKIHGII